VTYTSTSDFTDPSYILTFWTPLPRHILQGVDPASLNEHEFWLKPVGYGPYMVDAREPGAIRLRRNPYYLGSQPRADVLSFVFFGDTGSLRTAMLGGSLDVATSDRVEPDDMSFFARDEELDLLDVTYIPGPIWEHLDFNLDLPLFQDIRMRRAIAYGTNREAMVETLFAGVVPVLDSWIVPESWAAAPSDQLTRYPYHASRATTLLDELGVVDSNGDGMREHSDTQPLTITLLTTSSSSLREEIARLFKDDMAAIGLDVHIRPVSTQELYQVEGPLFQRQFELAQFAWIAGPDPGGLALWSCRAVPRERNDWQGNNFAGWCFLEADQAIRVASTSPNRSERLNAYLVQQQIFTRELPVLPLFQRPIVTINSPSMKHIQPDPIAPITWNIAEWVRE
jgi:peptide/nickel transport system substrate-binding protein